MKKHNIIFPCLLCMALYSCTDKDVLDLENSIKTKSQVLFSVDDFAPEPQTRTNCDPSSNYKITWASGDVIGIFPREGDQEPFLIPTEQVGLSQASFDGGYWALKDGKTYNAYYPFSRENYASAEMKTMIPVSYHGQYQNGEECNIGAFDYTYSDWATSEGGQSVSFKFHHIGSFLVFTLPIPATATYKTLTLSASSPLIPTEGTYDLTAASPSFKATPSSKVKSLSMSLNNCTFTAGDEKVFYMMVPPMDLSSCDLTVTLSTETSSCSYYIDSFSIGAGKLKKVSGSPKSSNIEGTLPDWLYLSSIIKVNTPGTLASLLTELVNENLNEITELRISGNLNKADISTLKKMKKLETLDLNRASIVTPGQENEWTIECTGYFDSDYDYNSEFLSLKELTLPRTLTRITYFNVTPKLEVLNIFDNVNYINGEFSSRVYFNYALQTITSLKEINVSEGNSNYASYDGVLYTKDYSTLIACPPSKTAISFPSGVTTISDKAFYNTYLTSVQIPEGVETIGNQAFYQYESKSLEILELPSTVTSLGSECFFHNNKLKSIIIPEGITSIPNGCFNSCSGLSTITIPSTVSYIGQEAFAYCTGLTSLYLLSTSASCTIGSRAFWASNNLEEVHVNAYWNASWQQNEFGNVWDYADGNIRTHILYVPSSLYDNYINYSAWRRQFSIQVE